MIGMIKNDDIKVFMIEANLSNLPNELKLEIMTFLEDDMKALCALSQVNTMIYKLFKYKYIFDADIINNLKENFKNLQHHFRWRAFGGLPPHRPLDEPTHLSQRIIFIRFARDARQFIDLKYLNLSWTSKPENFIPDITLTPVLADHTTIAPREDFWDFREIETRKERKIKSLIMAIHENNLDISSKCILQFVLSNANEFYNWQLNSTLQKMYKFVISFWS